MEHVRPFEAVTGGGLSLTIQDMSSAPTFKANVLSIILLDRHRVSADLGANPYLRRGDTTIADHARHGLYYINLRCSTARTHASVYAAVRCRPCHFQRLRVIIDPRK